MGERENDDTVPTPLEGPDEPTRIATSPADHAESVLEGATVADEDALSAPTMALGATGAVASGPVPQEAATELDPRLFGGDDPASARVLEAFGRPSEPTPVVASGADTPRDETPVEASPSNLPTPTPDPLARFERLRVPSPEEIQDAVQGTPTLSLDGEPVQRARAEPETIVDETAPVEMPKTPELRRIVERARAPDPASTAAPPRAPSVKADWEPSLPAVQPVRDESALGHEIAPAALPADGHFLGDIYNPPPPLRGPPVLAVIAGTLAVVALGLALLLLFR